MGHALRTCVLGMKIAGELGLNAADKRDLYYALLLKDAGCSSNASRMYQILGSDERSAKREIKTSDWTRVSIETVKYLRRHVRPDRPARERFMAVLRMATQREEQSKELIATRCERGAFIARKIGFPGATAEAILNLDEHWNGKGFPQHARGDEIPLASQIMNLAQTLEVYHALHGPAEALQTARRRSGRWFNPELVRIALSWNETDPVWATISKESVADAVSEIAPDDSLTVDESRLDAIAEAFADIIDAKSPFTYRHSIGVANAAIAMASQLGLDARSTATLQRAALLHDIGKLGVSNAILEKPTKLTDREWETVRAHPLYTLKILQKVPVFQEFAGMASAHHEKLDGSGYHLGLTEGQMSLSSRVLAVADIYDALAADRPYRKGLPIEKVLSIIGQDAPDKLDGTCVEALKTVVLKPEWPLQPEFECAGGGCQLVGHSEAPEEDLIAAIRVF